MTLRAAPPRWVYVNERTRHERVMSGVQGIAIAARADGRRHLAGTGSESAPGRRVPYAGSSRKDGQHAICVRPGGIPGPFTASEGA